MKCGSKSLRSRACTPSSAARWALSTRTTEARPSESTFSQLRPAAPAPKAEAAAEDDARSAAAEAEEAAVGVAPAEKPPHCCCCCCCC